MKPNIMPPKFKILNLQRLANKLTWSLYTLDAHQAFHSQGILFYAYNKKLLHLEWKNTSVEK